MATKGKSTTNFEKMGTTAASTVVNLSGAPSRNTKLVKKGHAKGGMLADATASHRKGIQERLGAQMHPSANLYAPNAAESGLTQRNTLLVPSAVGNRDFWAKRAEGPRI